MKNLLKLFLLAILLYSCESPNSRKDGSDCETTDLYLYEDKGYCVIIEIFQDSALVGKQRNKLDWYYEYPSVEQGEIYYFDSIIGTTNILKIGDTLKVQKIEYGQLKGSCGPQMDSAIFTYIE